MTTVPGARVTFSTVSSRRRARGWRHALDADRMLPMAAAAATAVIGMLLVFAAKGAPLGAVSRGLKTGAIHNLSAARVPADLDSALGAALEAAAERRFVSEGVVREVAAAGRRKLANVGALGAIRVAAEPLARRRDLPTIRDRAQARLDAVDLAAGSSAERRAEARAAATIALLTPDQLRDVKPAFVVRTPGEWRGAFFWSAVILLVSFALMHLLAHAGGRLGDPLLLPAVMLLASIGFTALTSLRDPVRDQMLFQRFAWGMALGGLAFVAASRVDYGRSVLRRLSLVPLAGALVLSLALVLFGRGPSGSDARVNLFGAQPVEVIRLLLALFLAGWFAGRWHPLRELHEPRAGLPAWLRRFRLPRREHALPVAIGVAAAIAFFFLQRDLGPALILIALFLCLYAVSRGSAALALAGLAVVIGAFAVASVLGVPSTVNLRTAMWWSPWENGRTRGDQVAHALWAFAAGGPTGTGLGLGQPESIPAAHTDLILAAVGEELGFAGVLACAVLFALLVGRGLRAARRAPDAYTLFLALGLTLGIALQTLLIAGGALALVPLSGVVTPFMSYGWSATIMNFAGLGMLWAISSVADPLPGASRAPERESRAFTTALVPGVRTLGWVLAGLAVVVVGKAAWVQVVRADATMARGQLARQADGELRYQYDPRLITLAATLPRGSILDRNGIPLATSNWSTLVEKREDYRRLGIDVNRACSPHDARHYPFGGATYHLLGDWVSRRDWGASNTGFIERSEDSRLCGYDDHSEVVTIRDPRDGRTRRVARRSLRELVPLWRHRLEPSHPAVRAIARQNHDLRTTVDVRLQLRASRILADRIRAAGLARGAVVVLDVETGEVLASVSHPRPDQPIRGKDHRLPEPLVAAGPSRTAAPNGVVAAAATLAVEPEPPDAASGPLFDRARFGLYPPGSTFKLVTAAAALELDPATAAATFPCVTLPDRRAGTIIAGRIVRDAPTDKAHGTPAMERATAVSCNAYYAQLGRRIGWDALAGMADRFGISTGEPAPDERLAHVIEASNGQADVVASPLRMARVAGTIAASGRLRSGELLAAAADSGAGAPVMSAATAATLGGYMRQAVRTGTGQRLSGLTPAVAGKTGTAQVANQASHSWFVGYAPYGPARRHIAFAVLIENGGYGAGRAAEVAGDVVAAARDLGITR